jgi:general stress protein 26
MAESIDNYELVSVYQMNPDDQARLLGIARECVFNWCTRDNWPMGVIMSCLWSRDRLWLTAGAHRHRIAAVKRNPQVSVVITSTGTSMGPGKTITVKGRCIVHEDRATKDWFYRDFSKHLYPKDNDAKGFEKLLDSPLRVVLEVVPEKYITYDGAKMMAHSAGKLDASQLTQPTSSDTVRLERELKRRGLK